MTGRKIDLTKREDLVEVLATFLCRITNIEPVDSTDGSPNWWIFNETATHIIADLENRGFVRFSEPKATV